MRMGITQCLCDPRCIPNIIIPWATLMPVTKCNRMSYCMHKVDIYHISGKFTINLTADHVIYIDASTVDILLFYYSMFITCKYVICTDGCGDDWHDGDDTIVSVSDNSIQFRGQRIEPYCAFTVRGGVVCFDTKSCGIKKFIALSLAVNGADLLY